jgi:transposase
MDRLDLERVEKLLERCANEIDMWAGRARMALDPAHNTGQFRSQFKSTPKELAELNKLYDELEAIREKVRHLEHE